MAKGGKRLSNDTKSPKVRTKDPSFTEEDMVDEIDTFHKQRDIVPLDVDSDSGSSDEDSVLPVYDIEGLDDDEDDDEEDDEEDYEDHGFAAKIAKQQKIMMRKTGGAEDETYDDSKEEREINMPFGRNFYGGEELPSSDEDDPILEEEEAIRLRKEMAKSHTMEDFMPDDSDEEESDSGEKKTLKDILPKTRAKSIPIEDKEDEDDADTAYEVVKDLNALSREEQMKLVCSFAPELVGLLSELKDTLDHIESKVNPLVNKVKRRNDSNKEVVHYLETKQLLLLAYCQAISLYLLLKSEGHSVRDHPVIARLVEIKALLDKMKQLDDLLPLGSEEILDPDHHTELGANQIEKSFIPTCEHVIIDKRNSYVSVRTSEEALPHQTSDLMKDGSLERNGNKQEKHNQQPHQTSDLMKDGSLERNGNKQEKHNQQVGLQSKEMLKLRESLEEKLKQKGVFSSIANTLDKTRTSKLVTRQFQTLDDFGDEVIDKERDTNLSNGLRSTKLSKLVATKLNKSKAVSGDDDLPMRDDIGERRRKHELRVLATAGVKSNDELKDEPEALRGMNDESSDDGDEGDSGTEVSEEEFYKQVKRQRIAKLSAKAESYSRAPGSISLEEPDLVDGRRHITRQIDKNRGLTRARKKLIKNPRKKYKLKHEKAVIRRKGQVRDIKKPTVSYGGETTGINPGISRSVRFKN